jgi:hypothetical protein
VSERERERKRGWWVATLARLDKHDEREIREKLRNSSENMK